MPTDPRKRQKRLERRATRRKDKKQGVAQAHGGGLPAQLSAACQFPVLHCWISNSLEPEGIGWVVLSRAFPNGQVAAVSFLVDLYCLGVKEAFAEVLHRTAYDSKYVRKINTNMPSRSVPPAEARKLLEDAVTYARGLGLAPHADYQQALLLFGDADAAQSNAHWEFGKDGKPFFISGPRDGPERCRHIISTLLKSCGGPGGFDFLIRVNPEDMDRYLPAGARLMPKKDEETQP